MKNIVKNTIKYILLIISILSILFFLSIFIKSGCKISDNCYLCFKYKGNQSKDFTEKKFSLVKKGMNYRDVVNLLGNAKNISENQFYKDNKEYKFEVIYENDWNTLFYIIDVNIDSIVVSKRIQDND